jgi:hypothetical protein
MKHDEIVKVEMPQLLKENDDLLWGRNVIDNQWGLFVPNTFELSPVDVDALYEVQINQIGDSIYKVSGQNPIFSLQLGAKTTENPKTLTITVKIQQECTFEEVLTSSISLVTKMVFDRFKLRKSEKP